MKLWLPKILVLLAWTLVLGHTVFPHHHHNEEQGIEHHDDDDDDHDDDHDHDQDHDHSIFAFGQLDDVFIPHKAPCNLLCDYFSILFIAPVSNFNFALSFFHKKPDYSFKTEFPPPGIYRFTLSLRGPPTH